MKTGQKRLSALLTIIICTLSAWSSAWAEEKVLTIYFAGTSFTLDKSFGDGYPELISGLYKDDMSREIIVDYSTHDVTIPSGTGTKYKAFLNGLTGFDIDPFHSGRTYTSISTEAMAAFEAFNAAEGGEQLVVNLVGFSRGGVSTMLISFALRNENPRVKINVLAVDPVPGSTTGNPIDYLGRANLNLEHVNQFVGIYAEDERTHRFEPILPGLNSNPDRYLLFSLRGAHETLVGNPDSDGHPGNSHGWLDPEWLCDYKICRAIALRLFSGPEWGRVTFNNSPPNEVAEKSNFLAAVQQMDAIDPDLSNHMRYYTFSGIWSGYWPNSHSYYPTRGFEQLAPWYEVLWVKPATSIDNERLMYRWPYDFINSGGSWDIVFYLNETNFKPHTPTDPDDTWKIIPSEMPAIESLTGNGEDAWVKVELLRGDPIPDVAELPFISGECPITLSTLSAPTATDFTDGQIYSISGDPDTGATITEPGAYTVTWTYTDIDGNETTQTQQVDAMNTPEIYVQADDTVFGEVETYSVKANHNYQVIGILSWTNETTGASGSVPASESTDEIEASDINLYWGPNVITFTGTNAFSGTTSDSVIITRSFEHGGDSPGHYASPGGTDTWPYTNLTTAANTIQAAIDATVGGDTVHVANGTYASGSATVNAMSNRVVLTKAITVQSVNGSDFTFIVGEGPVGATAMRCAYLSAGAELIGFTLTNGHTRTTGDGIWERSGGGAFLYGGTVSNCIITGSSAAIDGGGSFCYYAGVLNNCVIKGNSAGDDAGGAFFHNGGTVNNSTITDNTASEGGGVLFINRGTLNNCIISSNTATSYGGGAFFHYGGTLNNCTLSGNTATTRGGGVQCNNGGTLNNCIVWGNSASSYENWYGSGGWVNCCTTPSNGVDCTTDNPMLVGPGSNYRLQLASPCIDAGDGSVGLADDIEGTPRPLDGDNDGTAMPDIGAYEFISSVADTDGDGLADGAEIGTLGTSPVSSNTDGDGFNDYEEYVAATDGADSNDFFRIVSCDGKTVWFQSSAMRQYTLLWSLDLEEWSIMREQADIMGSGGLDSLTDPYDDPACFYRVQVEIP